RLAYEEVLRIPLLMRFPPMIEKGTNAEQMVLNIDLAPTLIEIAGGEPEAFIEGRSLLPLLKGQTPKDWRTEFLIEYYTDSVWPRMLNMGYRAIRTEQYKYIQYTVLEGMDEYYDLKNDPYELENSINNPDYKQTLDKMKKQLSAYPEEGMTGN